MKEIFRNSELYVKLYNIILSDKQRSTNHYTEN